MDLMAKWRGGGIDEVSEWGLRMIVVYSDVVLVILRLYLYKAWYSVNYGFGKAMWRRSRNLTYSLIGFKFMTEVLVST